LLVGPDAVTGQLGAGTQEVGGTADPCSAIRHNLAHASGNRIVIN
jgi:hypothetical protein